MIANDGTEVASHGEYREIVPTDRIVSTEVFEGLPEGMDPEEHASLNTVTFTGGRRSRCSSSTSARRTATR